MRRAELLFGAAGLITLLSIFLPHQPQLDTEGLAFVSIGAGVRCDAHGDDTIVAPILERLGYDLERAKTNIGLGRRVEMLLPSPATGSAWADPAWAVFTCQPGPIAREMVSA